MVTSLFGTFATQIFARPLPTIASHVLHVPSLQSYFTASEHEHAYHVDAAQ